MTFLHPWVVWLGVALAGIPVLVHFLTRPRPVRMPLSTLRFVREAIHQRRSRHRLRDLVILTLRTLAVLLVAFAIARPQIGPQPLVADTQARDAVRVVILDASQSMAATERGIQAIERARTIAAGHLRYRPGLWANLVVAGAAPRAVFDQVSTNFDALREELGRSRPLPQRMNVRQAVDLAARMLAPASEADSRRRELVVVSDFQRDNWGQADFSPLPEGTRIQLESVAAPEAPENLAILDVRCLVRSSQGQSAQLSAELGNFGRAPRQATVEVAIGDSTYRLSGTCPAGRNTTLTEEIVLRSLGWQSGEAKLVGVEDALDADNLRPFTVQIRSKPVYALLTRQPRTQRPSSSHYLECALVPDLRAEPRETEKASASVVRLNPDSASAAQLAPVDLILLDHPGKLTDDAVRLLAGLLRRGRPVLYVASELIDAANLKRLEDAAAGALQMPVEFAPPPQGQLRRDLFLTSVRANEAPFQVFGDRLDAVKSGLRFAGGLNSRRLPGGIEHEVLAAYNDGTACLVLTGSGAGALSILNADLGASNLPKTAAFVPLLGELIERMLNRNRAEPTPFCGEQLVVNLPGEAGAAPGLQIVAPATVDSPGGTFGDLVDEGNGAVWRWPSPSSPGVYEVRRGSNVVFALAVQVPPDESRLESLSPEVLRDRLGAGRQIYYRNAAASRDPRDDAWTWFVTACVICLLGELTALLAFRT